MAESDPTAIPEGVPGESVDALYSLPLDDFTKKRDELAKQLRQTGQRDEAGWVKGLRKPTAAAWVVNQLARTQRQDANRLIQAGAELSDVHQRLLRGEAGADDLRAAGEKENGAVRALLTRAAGLLDRHGHPPSAASMEKVEQTLRAVALDDDARAGFAAGRLMQERRPTGFAAFGEAVTTSRPARKGKRAAEPRAAERGEKRRRDEERARAREALKEAKREQRELRRAVAGAERDVERARAEAERAQARLEQATRALQEAQDAERQARERVTEAESRTSAQP